MQRHIEGKIACDFPDTWQVRKYDSWGFYKNRFTNCCNDNSQQPLNRDLSGSKAVDFIAIDPERTLWFLELKDFRQHRRTKSVTLWMEVALKARDTLAGLFAAKVEVGHNDHAFAQQSLTCIKLRVILHLEQSRTDSALFPRAYDPASVQQKLKQLVGPIDAHPHVVELQNMAHVPWAAESIP